MSGGVASAASAALLLSFGFKVTAVTFCAAGSSVGKARIHAAGLQCKLFGIDHVVYEYNPNSFSNLELIPALTDVAESINSKKIATGHFNMSRTLSRAKVAQPSILRVGLFYI
jgi:hypothetical protein